MNSNNSNQFNFHPNPIGNSNGNRNFVIGQNKNMYASRTASNNFPNGIPFGNQVRFGPPSASSSLNNDQSMNKPGMNSTFILRNNPTAQKFQNHNPNSRILGSSIPTFGSSSSSSSNSNSNSNNHNNKDYNYNYNNNNNYNSNDNFNSNRQNSISASNFRNENQQQQLLKQQPPYSYQQHNPIILSNSSSLDSQNTIHSYDIREQQQQQHHQGQHQSAPIKSGESFFQSKRIGISQRSSGGKKDQSGYARKKTSKPEEEEEGEEEPLENQVINGIISSTQEIIQEHQNLTQKHQINHDNPSSAESQSSTQQAYGILQIFDKCHILICKNYPKSLRIKVAENLIKLGASVTYSFEMDCTHVLARHRDGQEFKKAESFNLEAVRLGKKPLEFVTCHWVEACLTHRGLIPTSSSVLYSPLKSKEGIPEMKKFVISISGFRAK